MFTRSARNNPRQVALRSRLLPHIDRREKRVFDQAFLPPGILDSATAFDSGIDYLKSAEKVPAPQMAIWNLYQCAREITNPVCRLEAMTSLIAICAAFEVAAAPTKEA